MIESARAAQKNNVVRIIAAMKIIISLAMLLAQAGAYIPLPLWAGESEMNNDGGENRNLVILIGASIGNAWSLPQLPDRTGNKDYIFQYYGVYSFDKTEILENALLKLDKPAIVILKECAAFFPGDTDAYKMLVRKWVGMCREKGVIPVLATTVPVVKSFPLRMFLLGLLRFKWMWPSETFDGIIEYNDWIREYANEESIHVLDLEEALRTSEEDRHLNARYADTDGLHVNDTAYDKLDRVIIETLDEICAGESNIR